MDNKSWKGIKFISNLSLMYIENSYLDEWSETL